MVGKARARVILKKYVSAKPLSYFNIFYFLLYFVKEGSVESCTTHLDALVRAMPLLRNIFLQCKKILAHVIHVCRCRYRSTDKYTTDSKCTNIMCIFYTFIP